MEDVEGALGMDAPLSPMLFQVTPVLDSSSPPSLRAKLCDEVQTMRVSITTPAELCFLTAVCHDSTFARPILEWTRGSLSSAPLS